jgi:hypothetical protein
MSNKYAILSNNVVVNVIRLNQEDLVSYSTASNINSNDLVELDNSSTVSIGWQLVDGQFVYIEPEEE